MLRAKAISIMVRKAEQTSVFLNLQTKGLLCARPLTADCFTLTSAMGLGGGQTPVIVNVYD